MRLLLILWLAAFNLGFYPYSGQVAAGQTEPAQIIKLPAPQTSGGKPLLDCLKLRQSNRSYSQQKLSLQTLSNLLWAANGINRPESGKRTAPTAVNWQNIDVYVATADGLFLYDAKEQALIQILKDDIRALTGTQDFVKTAPVNLVYVADYAKIPRGSDEDKLFYSANHTGYIAQNVYLFCASEGLSTVVRAMINKEELARAMKLRPEQHIMLAQSIGYPQK